MKKHLSEVYFIANQQEPKRCNEERVASIPGALCHAGVSLARPPGHTALGAAQHVDMSVGLAKSNLQVR